MEEILEFWFGSPQTPESRYDYRRKLWFGKSTETDQAIRDRFLTAYEQAAAGELDDWQKTAAGTLALIVLLDQFPRNLFRGQAKSFATDEKARQVAKWAIAHGIDQQLEPIQRLFIYLPLEHSENLEEQQQSVALSHQLSQVAPELQDCYEYALKHLQVIERFGRFPHRNAALGRENTPEETEFLKQPGSSF